MLAKPPGPNLSSHTKKGPVLVFRSVVGGQGLGEGGWASSLGGSGARSPPRTQRADGGGGTAESSFCLLLIFKFPCFHFDWNKSQISLLRGIFGYFLLIGIVSDVCQFWPTPHL